MTAGNSTTLSDGASRCCSPPMSWAGQRGLKPQAYIVDAQTAAVDHVHKREGADGDPRTRSPASWRATT